LQWDRLDLRKTPVTLPGDRCFERHSKIALFGEVGNFDTAKLNRKDRVVGQSFPRFIRGIQIMSVSSARTDGV
jgi:hypothetical protein